MKRVLRSPAKINIGLWVIGKRPDGYNEIRTIFYRFDELFDEIEIEESEELQIIVEGMHIPMQENTVYRAIRLLEEITGYSFPLRVIIKKRIPAGAGLGGGSSNAGIILDFLNDFYRLGIPGEELISLSSRIGADVPFFVSGFRMAVGRGIGEELEGVDMVIPFSINVHVPDVFIETARMYGEVERRNLYVSEEYAEGKINSIIQALREKDFDKLSVNVENVFQEVAIQLYPELRDFRNMLEKTYPLVFMSGSGSAFVGMKPLKFFHE